MADESSPAVAFPFLSIVGAAERSIPRTLVTLVLGAAAGLIAALAALTGVMLAATAITARGGDICWTEAIGRLMAGDRPDRALTSYIFELAVVGASSIAAAMAFTAVSARRAGRPLRSFLTIAPRFRWRHALVGLLVFLPVVAAEIWLGGLAKGASPGPLATPGASGLDRLAYGAAALVFLWLAALAEELLFRGWLLQQTHALTRRLLVVIAVNAALFTLAHGDLSLGGLLTRFAMGAGWAWVVLRLDGVEFTAGAHLANNLAIALLAQPVLLAAAASQPLDPGSVALQVGSVAILALAVEGWVRRRAAGGRPRPAIGAVG